jgi:hypothetical protein
MKININFYFILLIIISLLSCKDKYDGPYYKVSGIVYQNGLPINNVSVDIGGIKTNTDIKGSFEIAGLPEGGHILNILKKNGNKKGADTVAFVERSFKINLPEDTLLEYLKLPEPVLIKLISRTSKEGATIGWTQTDIEDFREYKLFRHSTSGLDATTGDLIQVSTTANDTTFTDTFELGSEGYFYRVYVMNDFGRLGGSNIISVSTRDEEIISKYTIQLTNSIGIPNSTPVGIASDQNNLWIMCGAYNALEHTLIYYNPDTYKVIKSFTFNNLIERPGTGVGGIAWDGTYIWISVGGNTNKLVKVDINTGSILQSWASPAEGYPTDLDWDGELLWISSGNGQIYKFNTLSGGSELFFSRYPDREISIATRNNEVWVGDFVTADGNITIYNKLNGNSLGTIKDALPTNHRSFCFHKGKLAVIADGNIKFYEIKE